MPVLRVPMVKPVAIGSFSGCGGSSLGYKRAGFDVQVAIEIDPYAVAVYEANHPDALVLQADIRELHGEQLLELVNLKCGELPLWEGSPPCSKFSMAGQRHKGWNKVTQTDSENIKLANVEDLFLDWIRLLNEMQPMVAVAENVPGLAVGPAKGKLAQFVTAIRAAGYMAQVWILPAERYGVPQKRRRLFIACVRKDLSPARLIKPLPTTDPMPYGPAIADLPTVKWEGWGHNDPSPSEHHAPWVTGYKAEDHWRLTNALGLTQHPKHFSMILCPTHEPCPTLTSFAGNIACAGGLHHPHEPRRFSIAELKRICGYPDNFAFPVSYKQAVARLGNSVPPPLAEAVGNVMMNVLADNGATPQGATGNVIKA